MSPICSKKKTQNNAIPITFGHPIPPTFGHHQGPPRLKGSRASLVAWRVENAWEDHPRMDSYSMFGLFTYKMGSFGGKCKEIYHTWSVWVRG